MEAERADFVDEQRRRLLQRLLAPWRRRGATLLQVGLGDGLLPDFFWEAGFDVAALDADPATLEAAREATGPRVDYALGKPDYLPFDDGRFDHVVLAHLGLTPRMALGEALRVASRGVIVLEWNRLCLAALSRGPWRRGVWPWSLTWLGRKACPDGRMSLYSVLPWPLFVWPGRKPAPAGAMDKTRPSVRRSVRRARDLVVPAPVGAIMGLRLEKNPALSTPVGAVTDAPQSPAYARQPVVNRVGRGMPVPDRQSRAEHGPPCGRA